MVMRGSRSFDALDKRWTLIFDINAICAVEDAKEKPFLEAVGEMIPMLSGLDVEDKAGLEEASKRMRFSDLRELFHIGLQAHHPDLTVLDAGELMHEVGVKDALPMIVTAISESMGVGEKPAGNPPQAKIRSRRGG